MAVSLTISLTGGVTVADAYIRTREARIVKDATSSTGFRAYYTLEVFKDSASKNGARLPIQFDEQNCEIDVDVNNSGLGQVYTDLKTKNVSGLDFTQAVDA